MCEPKVTAGQCPARSASANAITATSVIDPRAESALYFAREQRPEQSPLRSRAAASRKTARRARRRLSSAARREHLAAAPPRFIDRRAGVASPQERAGERP